MDSQKSLLPETATANEMIFEGRIITFSADSNYSEGYYPYCARNSYTVYPKWFTTNSPMPHYLTIDLGVRCSIQTVSFYPCDDNISVLVKDYDIQISNDGTNFTTVHSAKYEPKEKLTHYSTLNAWQQEVINFNIAKQARYVRIKVLSSYDMRGLSWTALADVNIFEGGAAMQKLYLSRATGAVYGVK